jgi:peptidoglycan/xylan/chitin deacetylase (PgdA/CDA1 family)
MLKAGWEFMSHGWKQKALQNDSTEKASGDAVLDVLRLAA